MSWSVNVVVKDGNATVTTSTSVKDGWYTIGGHETETSASVSASAQILKAND